MYSNYEIQTAILNTADIIEEDPRRMEFMSGLVSHAERDRACPLAWIGFFLDMPDTADASDVADAIGIYEDQFYHAMDLLTDGRRWDIEPSIIPPALRQFAERYPC